MEGKSPCCGFEIEDIGEGEFKCLKCGQKVAVLQAQPEEKPLIEQSQPPEELSAPRKLFCKFCGEDFQEEMKFCPKCGTDQYAPIQAQNGGADIEALLKAGGKAETETEEDSEAETPATLETPES